MSSSPTSLRQLDQAPCPPHAPRIPSERGLTAAKTASMAEYADGALRDCADTVAVEEPLHVTVQGGESLTLMRTPGDDRHLILGHLYSLGLIRSAADLLELTTAETGTDRTVVRLRPLRAQCTVAPLPSDLRIAPETVFRLRERFEQRQKLYHHTGSTHAAALFESNGDLLAYGEDVSRHCAFDKAVGRALTANALSRVDIAMLTSRLAWELTTKAAMADIPILCGFSAATSAGMEFARRNDITLIGRISRDKFRVYANAWRIQS